MAFRLRTGSRRSQAIAIAPEQVEPMLSSYDLSTVVEPSVTIQSGGGPRAGSASQRCLRSWVRARRRGAFFDLLLTFFS